MIGQNNKQARTVGRRCSAFVSIERGAAAVEFALVLMLLVPLLGGLIDSTINFQLKRKLVDGIRSGARSGAQSCFGGIGCVAGNPVDADNQALEAIRGVLGSTAKTINRIVLYKAASPGDQVPPACLETSSGIAGLCEVVETPFQSDAAYSGSTLWPSTTRRRSDNADYLGVYAIVDHKNLIGLFGDQTKITARASFRLESPPTPNESLPTLPAFPQTPFPWEFYTDLPLPPPAVPLVVDPPSVVSEPVVTPVAPVVVDPLAGNGAG